MIQTSIDFDFVRNLEGKNILHGYVPSNGGYVIGNSGVTIATGVDIGQMSTKDLKQKLGKKEPFPLHLYVKLLPYVGLKGMDAIDALSNRQLEITQDEANLLSGIIEDDVVASLVGYWNSYGNPKFDELPSQIQTVLFSLAYNFGTNLPDKLPNTWAVFRKGAREKDWGETYNYMLNFPSKQRELRKRRLKEAMLIYELLPI